MTIIDNRTVHRNYPLPNNANNLLDDVARLILSIIDVDVDIDALYAAVAAATSTVSPHFTGTPTAPTPTAGDNSGTLATTAFITTALVNFLTSPAFLVSPTAPTQIVSDNSTKLANTAFVARAVANLVNSSPASLDTLKELADALGDDANFATTITTLIATKLALSGGTMSGDIAMAGHNISGLAQINGAGIKGNRSAVINGNFDIWQRALSSTANGFGSADRSADLHSGSTKTHSQQAFTPGQTAVPGNPKFFSRTAVTSVAGAGNYVLKSWPIEDVNTYAGKTVTAVFWARSSVAQNMAFDMRQYFGTGGSPSADVTAIGAQRLALTTSWQKFALVISVPPINSKTLGTNGDHALIPTMWFDAGSSFNARTGSLGQLSGTFDISRFDLIEGDVSLEPDPHANESLWETLRKCERYCEKSYDYGLFQGSSGSGPVFETSLDVQTFHGAGYTKFRTRKRVSPTLTLWAAVTGTAGVFYNYSTSANQGNTAVSSVCETAFRAYCGNNALTANNLFGFQWLAESELAP